MRSVLASRELYHRKSAAATRAQKLGRMWSMYSGLRGRRTLGLSHDHTESGPGTPGTARLTRHREDAGEMRTMSMRAWSRGCAIQSTSRCLWGIYDFCSGHRREASRATDHSHAAEANSRASVHRRDATGVRYRRQVLRDRRYHISHTSCQPRDNVLVAPLRPELIHTY